MATISASLATFAMTEAAAADAQSRSAFTWVRTRAALPGVSET